MSQLLFLSQKRLNLHNFKNDLLSFVDTACKEITHTHTHARACAYLKQLQIVVGKKAGDKNS